MSIVKRKPKHIKSAGNTTAYELASAVLSKRDQSLTLGSFLQKIPELYTYGGLSDTAERVEALDM